MNGATPGGAYLGRLQQEHRDLNSDLLEIRHEFAALTTSRQPQLALAEIAVRIERLAKELRLHFAEEEEGGCFEEVQTRCPSLSAQVHKLLGEHPHLLLTLERLVADVEKGRLSVEQLQRTTETFTQRLKDHEVAESRLLQMAFGGDASEYEAEGNE
jgi:hypothetical protein